MAGTARVECSGCGHIGAMHGQNGCRLNGCRCPEFNDGTPRRQDPAERAFATQAKRIADLERRVTRLEAWVPVFVGGLLGVALWTLAQAVLP